MREHRLVEAIGGRSVFDYSARCVEKSDSAVLTVEMWQSHATVISGEGRVDLTVSLISIPRLDVEDSRLSLLR